MKPYLESYMVKSPYVGNENDGLKEALDLMHECNIRHLPVVTDGHLSGLISERDLREALALPQGAQLKVGDIMKRDVYIARRRSTLKQVVRAMQEAKFGSAVVVNESQEVIGIFTTTDALRILGDLLENDEDSRVISLEDYLAPWLPSVGQSTII